MNKFGKYFYLTTIYLFFYIPIAILIIYSFNISHYSLVWHGFSLTWYKQLMTDSQLQLVTLHSLIIGILSATIATILGTTAATILFRKKFYGKKLLHSLMFILIVSPDIVMGISLLILFSTIEIPLGFSTLLLSHITFCLPFVAITVYSRIIGLDKNIFEAARDLGASEWITFKRVIVPLLWPAIIAGWLLSFTLSLDDVIISYFVTGPEFQILPLQIYSLVKLGVNPEINALCSVMFVATIIIVIFSQLVLKKSQ